MNLGNNRTRWHDTGQRAVLDTARNAGLRVEEGLLEPLSPRDINTHRDGLTSQHFPPMHGVMLNLCDVNVP